MKDMLYKRRQIIFCSVSSASLSLHSPQCSPSCCSHFWYSYKDYSCSVAMTQIQFCQFISTNCHFHGKELWRRVIGIIMKSRRDNVISPRQNARDMQIFCTRFMLHLKQTSDAYNIPILCREVAKERKNSEKQTYIL